MSDARFRAAQALSVDRVTAEVVPALVAAGVESILLKGPSFRSLLYPEGGRAYGDVDLLVQVVDVATATNILLKRGFVDVLQGYAPVEKSGRAIAFVRTAGSHSGSVDLHWNLDVPADPAVTWRVLSAHTEKMVVGRVEVTILDDAGRAMHVALHAAAELTQRAAEDLRRAVRVIQIERWAEATDLARALNAEDAFAFGLRLDPDGDRLARELRLTTRLPDPWLYSGDPASPRGAMTFSRLLMAPTLARKALVLSRWSVPSRARVRRVTRSAASRRWVAAAYLEYWFDVVRAAPPAIWAGVATTRQIRRSRRS